MSRKRLLIHPGLMSFCSYLRKQQRSMSRKGDEIRTRCPSPRVFPLLALAVMTMCLSSPVLAVTIHDPVADYDAGWLAGTNPNGVWTYGWSSMLTSSLTLYPRNRTTTQDCGGSTYRAWDDPANSFGFTPAIIKNIGPDCSNGNVDIPAGVMTLHFGGLSGRDYSHIVFTAPFDAVYLLDVTFTGRQNSLNSDVHILANGSPLLSDLITGNLQTKSFAGTVFLTAGQTIDFAVGPGMFFGLHPGHIGLSGTIQVIPSDSDGDGIVDDEDQCPNSNPSATVVIDGCDSGVGNTLFPSGCKISDFIGACAQGVGNHGQFVSCVSRKTNDLQRAGTITGRQKGAIQSCAAQAGIP